MRAFGAHLVHRLERNGNVMGQKMYWVTNAGGFNGMRLVHNLNVYPGQIFVPGDSWRLVLNVKRINIHTVGQTLA